MRAVRSAAAAGLAALVLGLMVFELASGETAARLQGAIFDHYWRFKQIAPSAVVALKAAVMDDVALPLARKHAFHLWEQYARPEDLADLAALQASVDFSDAVLRTRLRLGDPSVADSLVAKLRMSEHPEWWLAYCPQYWSVESVRTMFTQLLDQRLAALPMSDGLLVLTARANIDYDFCKALKHLDPPRAEEVLLPRWDQVAQYDSYLQCALAADTPELARRVGVAISKVTNPAAAFGHIGLRSQQAGHNEGRPVPLHALTPYLTHIGQMDLSLIAEEANRQSMQVWRHTHVDPLLEDDTRKRVASTDHDLLTDFIEHFQRAHGVDSWFRVLDAQGSSPRKGLEILRAWSASTKSTAAFHAYDYAVRQYGSREDLDLLAEEAPAEETQVVAFTRYFVYRRSGYLGP